MKRYIDADLLEKALDCVMADDTGTVSGVHPISAEGMKSAIEEHIAEDVVPGVLCRVMMAASLLLGTVGGIVIGMMN